MENTLKKLIITISGPSDINRIKQAVDKSVKTLNDTKSIKDTVIEVKEYMKLNSGYNVEGVQTYIEQTSEFYECDIFILIFYKKIGSQYQNFSSTSIYELDKALKNNNIKDYCFYYKDEEHRKLATLEIESAKVNNINWKKYKSNEDLKNFINAKIMEIINGSIDPNDISTILKRIKQENIKSANESLFSHNLDNVTAPKNLESIFVSPRLLKLEDYFDSEFEYDKENQIDWKNLINYESDILLTGIKEIGKTTLLKRITMECFEFIEHYNTLPIYIDFNKVDFNVNNEIAKFLKIPNEETNKWLTSEKVLILLDNFSFKNEIQNNKLFNFFKAYDNIKFIISYTNESFDNKEALTPIKKNIPLILSIIKIEEFQSKEIMELIQKWYGKDTFDNIPLNYSGFIEILASLDISRTPLSISLILSMVEQKKDFKPKNYNKVLETYVDFVLKKGNLDNEDGFDFENKKYYLQYISTEIFKLNFEKNIIKEDDLVSKINNKLIEFGQTFSANEIIDYFIRYNILRREEEFIKFKYYSIYQYLLARSLENNEYQELKEKLFKNPKKIYLIDVFDYYQETNQDKDLLAILESSLDEKFNTLNKMFEEMEFSQMFFEINSIAVRVNNDIKGLTKQIKESKPNNEEVHKYYDNHISNSELNTKINQLTEIDELYLLLKLVSKVLKNTDRIDKEYKLDLINKLFQYSLKFSALLQRLSIIELIEDKEELSVKYKGMLLNLIMFSPLFVSKMLSNWIGSKKIMPIIEIKAKEYFKNDADYYLQFISLITLINNNPAFAVEYIKRYLKNKKSSKYLNFLFYLELTVHYNYQIDTPIDENTMLDFIIKSITKISRIDKSKKGQIKENLKNRKKQIKDKNQLVLFK